MNHPHRWLCAAFVQCFVTAAIAADEPSVGPAPEIPAGWGAEYAVRWLAAGAPDDFKTAEDTLKTLFPGASGEKRKEVSVRYFDWATHPETKVPPLVDEILRQRKMGTGKAPFELMFKLRSKTIVTVSDQACRLIAPAGSSIETKREVDLSAAGSNAYRAAYSFSCTIEKLTAPLAPPADLLVTPQSCETSMTRITHELPGTVGKDGEKQKVKFETWRLPEGELIEISSSDLSAKEFEGLIVEKVVTQKVSVIPEGKTQLAGKCTAPSSTPAPAPPP